jgi:cell division protein FtsI/penicillin-binding protein 2
MRRKAPLGSTRDGPDSGRRAVFIAASFALVSTLVMLFVVGRVAQLKVAPGERLSAYISDRVGHQAEPSPRGDLLDRRGRPLSMSEIAFRVVIDPVTAEPQMDRVITALAEALGVPPEEIGTPLVRAVARNQEARMLSLPPDGPDPSTRPDEGTLIGRITGAIDRARRTDPETDRIAGQRRYLPVGPVLDRDIAQFVRRLGLPGVIVEKQLVRTTPGGEDAASIVGKVGYGHAGLMGVERSLDERLRGEDGRIGLVRDAGNKPVLIRTQSSEAGSRGEDVRLSIDLELQRIAIEELGRGLQDADAAGGRLVMLQPMTGEILAMVDLYREVPGIAPFPWVEPGTPRDRWPALPPPERRPRYQTIPPDPGREVHPALGRNRCVEDIYEPGSTFKSFIWATGLQLGLMKDGEILDTTAYRTPYGRGFSDVTKRNSQSWDEILVHSSNVGMVKLSERMKPDQMHAAMTRFGFGSTTRLGLPGEAAGIVTPLRDWTVYTHSSVAIGHEVAVTPVQMVRAFAAYARTGELAGTLPHLRLIAPSGEELAAEPLIRVLDAPVAEHTRRVLERVAERMDASMRRQFRDEPRPGYTMFGKSGTADIPVVAPLVERDGRMVRMGVPRGGRGYFHNQYNSSFVAGAPTETPRIVVLVVIDDPGPDRVRQKQHYGSSVAGPVVRRVVERSLRYMGVPPAIESVAAGDSP